MPPLNTQPNDFFQFKVHGNYCGPGWNQGKWQTSKKRDRDAPEPIDDFDRTCMIHDDAYASNKRLKTADYDFFKANVGKDLNIKRNIAGLAVGIQSLFRSPDQNYITDLAINRSFQVKKPIPTENSFFSKKNTPRMAKSSIKRSKRSNSSVRPKRTKRIRTVKKTQKKKKTKRVRRNKNKMFLYVKKFEQGGNITCPSNDALYLGHSIASLELYRSLAGAIVAKLFKKAGITIVDWMQGIPTPSTMTFVVSQFTNDDATSITKWYYTPAAGAQFYTIANGFMNAIQSNITVAGEQYQIFKISLYDGTVTAETIAGGATQNPISVLNAQETNLQFDIYSTLTVQNRTLGKEIIANENTEVDESYTSITHNPLVGKAYQLKSWGNGFLPNTRILSTITTYDATIAKNTTGLFGVAGGASNNDALLAKPPPPSYFQNTKAVSTSIGAGQIKKMKFRFKSKISLPKLMEKVPQMFFSGASSVTDFIPFGTAQMIALEKQLDSRDETSILSALSFQLDQTYKCNVFNKKGSKPLAIVESNSTAINF